MAYQVKTTTSYGGRLKKALKGVVGGFIMFVAGTALLFWNEGRFVNRRAAIGEAERKCVSIDETEIKKVDPDLNGQVIHASAFANTTNELTDAQFNVTTVAIALDRKVEYYQYEEHKKTETRDKIGGGEEKTETYTYKPAWVSKPVNSGEFHDPEYKGRNKVLTTIEPNTEYAETVTFGAYRLPRILVRQMKGDKPVAVEMSDEARQQWTQKLGGAAASPAPATGADTNENAVASAPAAGAASLVHVEGNVVYFGKSFNSGDIGDVRVTLTKVEPADVSIIAEVKGSTFVEYVAKNGGRVSSLEMGEKSAKEMFGNLYSMNTIMAWILRLVGTLLVIFGLTGIFGIVTQLLKVLPFLANIVGAGIGLVCGVLGFAWSLIIISLAWLVYRPLIGVPLLLVAIGLVYYLKKIAPKNKAQAAAKTSPAP